MQLQRYLDGFNAAGIRVFAVSYDSQEVLGRFSDEFGIEYPLLSDENSEVIRRFGILNTLVRPEESVYGIPYPGLYLVDEDGVVVEKVFHQRYQVRDSAQSVLRSRFGATLDMSENPHAEASSAQAHVSATLAAEQLVPQQRVNLYVRFALEPGLHIYGREVRSGYFATEVEVAAPEAVQVGASEYPPTRPFRMAGVDEDFEVLDGEIEIAVPLTSTVTDGETVPLDVTVRYQACDDRQCFLPQEHRLHLEVPVGRLNRPLPRT
ncbi:MAG: redoxin domain-containing protein [Dehalococcoidia bacterium]|nr:redoxin domain-containing protein [Dehalococcoidia bacterium]